MARPCECGNAKAGGYEAGQCIDCWKWLNSPWWRERWSTDAPAARAPRPGVLAAAGPMAKPEPTPEYRACACGRVGCPNCTPFLVALADYHRATVPAATALVRVPTRVPAGAPLPAAARGACEFLDESTVLETLGRGCQACWVHPCEVFGKTTRATRHEGLACCVDCPAHVERGREAPAFVVLENHLSPGDAVVLSAAVESLHRAHPGRFVTAVDSTAPEIWRHHPRVLAVADLKAAAAALEAPVRTVRADYPAIHQCDDRAIHFMQAYCEHLEAELGVPVPLSVNRPHLSFSAEELSWTPQVREIEPGLRYWVVNAGRKDDFTAKFWGTERFQKVVDLLAGAVRFVQVGEAGHHHPPLSGVLDLRGKTDTRQLMRLVYHAEGGLGPSTLLQHLCAAFQKPYVLLAGGREPRSWQEYPTQTMFAAVGTLDCCRFKACWKSRTVAVGDGSDQDKSLCLHPVGAGEAAVPLCLDRVSPEAVAAAVLAYGGAP
jgi:ADP-heptose:LPS heptosyltransferase